MTKVKKEIKVRKEIKEERGIKVKKEIRVEKDKKEKWELRRTGTKRTKRANIALTQAFTITVNSGKYYIDGVQEDTPVLLRGSQYIFNQNNASNSNHPLALSRISDGIHGGGIQYTSGWVYSGIAGSDGIATFTVPYNSPKTLLLLLSKSSWYGWFYTN